VDELLSRFGLNLKLRRYHEAERGRGAVRHMMDLHAAIERVRGVTGARSTSIRLTLRPRSQSVAGHGRAVQVDPNKLMLKAPEFKRLKP
jgi:hypothetical protein